MRLRLLLLLSLFVSDLSPLRDEDGVRENLNFCTDLLLNGCMTPRGLRILQTQSERCCMSMQRDCVFVCEQLKQETSPSELEHKVYDACGCSFSDQEFLGKNKRTEIPSLVVPLLCGKRKSTGKLKVKRVMDEAAHIPMRMIKLLPYSVPAWFLHHHPAASGQAFFLETSLSWAPAIIAKLQRKMLTERKCAAETVVIPCCFRERGAKRARSIKKALGEQSGRGRKESKLRAMCLRAASLIPLHKSHLRIKRNAVGIRRENQHLSFLLQKTTPRPQALSVYADDDGFYVERKPLLVPREQPESINKPQYKIRAALDDNKEDFSGKIITKQAKLQRPEGGRATERSHKNIENGNQERLAYVLKAGVDNNDDKQMLRKVEEDILIVLFPQKEAQTGGKDADVRETVKSHINELDDPPPAPDFIEGKFIIYPGFKHPKETRPLLEIDALKRSERKDIKAGKVITACKKQVTATKGKMEHGEANNASSENMRINHTKQDAASDESLIPMSPSITVIELETAKTERSPVNKEIKATTTSTDVLNQSSTRGTVGPPSTTKASPDAEIPRFIRRKTTVNKDKKYKKWPSGLRMRDDFSAKLHKGKPSEDGAAAKEAESKRKDNINDSENLFTSKKPEQTTQKQAGDPNLRNTHPNTLPCRGLIHRTEAGWRHCLQRYNRDRSQTVPPPGSFKDTERLQRDPPSIPEQRDKEEDEYDHFYYIDGVMKRVRNNYFPYDKRRRLRKRREDHTENNVSTGREERENLLAYFRLQTSRKEEGNGKDRHH